MAVNINFKNDFGQLLFVVALALVSTRNDFPSRKARIASVFGNGPQEGDTIAPTKFLRLGKPAALGCLRTDVRFASCAWSSICRLTIRLLSIYIYIYCYAARISVIGTGIVWCGGALLRSQRAGKSIHLWTGTSSATDGDSYCK